MNELETSSVDVSKTLKMRSGLTLRVPSSATRFTSNCSTKWDLEQDTSSKDLRVRMVTVVSTLTFNSELLLQVVIHQTEEQH